MRRSVLEQVLAALGGNGAQSTGRRGPGRPPSKPRAPRAARGGKRTPEQVEQMGHKLLAYVKSKPGLRADQLAKVFHSDVKTIRLPMQRLLATKKIKTKGQRRGMTYYAA